MKIIGLHVTQYMHVLFYKVHIYIQKSHDFCREPHQFTEILIINVDENTCVIHGNIDKLLLLNATAVSDFKKTLRKMQNLSTELRAQNSQNKNPPCCAVNISQK